MEFLFEFDEGNGTKSRVLLPVPPKEFEVGEGQTVNVEDVNMLGEIAVVGERKLETISLSSFFPVQRYSFVQVLDEYLWKPYQFVEMFLTFKRSKKPVRLIVSDTNINGEFVIENFTYGEKDGTGDIAFALSLREYRYVQVTQVGQKNDLPKRPVSKSTPKEYTVKKGDTLSSIAKKMYGDSSKYKQIADANGIKDVNKLQVNQKLVIP